MAHFTVWQWTDFVRGINEPARSAMSTHLAGCPRCRRTVEVLQAVADLARREDAYTLPDRAIRYAQAIYSLYRPEKSRLARLVARVVHDSASAPLAVGLRAQDRLSRHLLYQAGSYHLDLQLEHQPSGRITLIGQLADQKSPATSTASVPVWLMERSTLKASALCNQFGEFRLEYVPARNLRLRIPVLGAGGLLEVPLTPLHSSTRPRPKRARPADRAGSQSRRRRDGEGESHLT